MIGARMTTPSPDAAFRRETRRAFGNMVFKAISIPVERAGRFLLAAVAAPTLGEGAFGSYQVAATATGFLVLATEMGLGAWTTRALARDRSRADAIVGTALRRRGRALVGFAAAVFLLAAGIHASAARALLLWLAVAAVANAAVDYAATVFRGFERLQDEAWVNVARAVLVTGTGLAAVRLGRSAVALAAGSALGSLAAAGCMVALIRRHYPAISGRVAAPDPELARSAAREGLPLWAITAVTLLYSRGDILMMRLFVDTPTIGAYSAADKVFEGVSMVTGVMLAALFPPLARAHHEPDAQRRWERLVAGLLLAAGTAAGGLFFAFAVPIVAVVYGSGFADAAPSLRVLGLAAPLVCLNYALSHILVARNEERRSLVFAGIALLANVAANRVLLPRLGGPGAAWATLVTEATMTLCCLVYLASLRARARAGSPAGARPRRLERSP
jgi:O-antigen/teichoic acid export membrane protein